MYELTVKAHINLMKTWNFIDEKYANDMFNVAIKCIDCEYAEIIDAMTGEILKSWHYINGLMIE